jgi:hypothetical protein
MGIARVGRADDGSMAQLGNPLAHRTDQGRCENTPPSSGPVDGVAEHLHDVEFVEADLGQNPVLPC